MVYISLNTSTQALSPFCTIIISTLTRDKLQMAQCSFSNTFLAYYIISSAIYISWKYIYSNLLSLPASWTWVRQTLVLRTDHKRSQSDFFTQCFTVYVLCCVVDTSPDIYLSKERMDQSIGKSVIKITSQYKGAEIEISSRAAH